MAYFSLIREQKRERESEKQREMIEIENLSSLFVRQLKHGIYINGNLEIGAHV